MQTIIENLFGDLNRLTPPDIFFIIIVICVIVVIRFFPEVLSSNRPQSQELSEHAESITSVKPPPQTINFGLNSHSIQVNLIELHKLIVERFNENDLKELCRISFDEDMEEITPSNANRKEIVWEVIDHHKRRNTVSLLVIKVIALRHKHNWDTILS